MIKKIKLSILIPVYNEVVTIEEILKRISEVSWNLEAEKEIIIVDDASTDGTREIIERLDGENIKKAFHDRNQGKGAAIRTALKYVTGDIVIIQDADLEYYPDEYPQIINPILHKKADVVFGSRFIGAHRCFLFTHYIGNKIVNLFANILYNTNLSDLMTGYKVFTTDLIKEFPLKANRFGFEAEITGMVFKKNLRVYEIPISYSGRDYREGKKITCKDFFSVIWWLIYTRFRLLKEIGRDTLDKLSYVQNYNSYIFEKLKPYLGKKVLEIGAGTGNMTRFLLKNRQLVVAVDKSPHMLACLSQSIPDSNIFRAFNYDIERELPQMIKMFKFNSAVCINVLEHISDEKKALINVHQLLENDGRFILVVPNYKYLFSEFDKLLGHYRRYDRKSIEELLKACGFCFEKVLYLNVLGIFFWWFNFKILKRKSFSSMQLFVFNHLVWLVKLSDFLFKKTGLSVLVVGRKK